MEEQTKKCPYCGGFLIKRKSKDRHWFCGCTNFPYCEYTEALSDNGNSGVRYNYYVHRRR